MSNLLVVDFDYFFRNSLEWGHFDDPAVWLYDWGHMEGSRLHSELVWPIRASHFWANDLELPQAVVPDNFWQRFNITDEAVLEVSDSNMWSGIAADHREFKHVWLFDAHHDLYRIKTVEQLEQWQDRNEVTCEDWMFVHHIKGARLHWRWPAEHKQARGMRASIPRWVNCDARKDDGGKIQMEFDAVSICRSGAWVPAWCDDDFSRFVNSCPVNVENVRYMEDVSKREWRADAEVAAKQEKRMKELIAQLPDNSVEIEGVQK